MTVPARVRWLRCAECNEHLLSNPFCSDLATLTLHWMSKHTARWLQMHPDDAPYLDVP